MKKLNVNRHTGPAFIVVIGFSVLIAGLFTTPKATLVFVLGVAIFFSPWWTAYLWNKFIATEEEYYD